MARSTKPKTTSKTAKANISDDGHLFTIRMMPPLREKIRVAAFKARLPDSVYARQLLEAALKQRRAT
jgi:hypothetical protein